MKTVTSPIFIPLTLFILSSIGAFIRFVNVSPFKFYPDAYQSLIVAKNIQTYQSVLGRLGIDGMVYPDFFMWTRPGYPLLINLGNIFTQDFTKAAYIIAFLSGILAIPLVFFLLRRIYANTYIAVIGSFLLSFSFLHTVWGGYIMTETTGVLFLLLTLFFLFNGNKKDSIGKGQDLLTGICFACAVLTRYEYLILLFPFCLTFLHNGKFQYRRILTIFAAFLFVMCIVVSWLFPLQGLISIFLHQTNFLLQKLFLVFMGIVMLVLLFRILRPQQKDLIIQKTAKGISIFLGGFTAFILLQTFFPHIIPYAHELSAIRKVYTQELLITGSALLGFFFLLRGAKYRQLALFSFISTALLGFIYYFINPDMERYWTHMLPFLLIPAAFGLYTVLQRSYQLCRSSMFIRKLHGIAIFVVFGLLVILQTAQVYFGLRIWDGGWQNVSYEEKSAMILKKYIPDKDTMLLASFPEPYYYFTGFSTHSISDTYPYVHIDDSLNNRTIIIIEDMGMRDIFPNFTSFLTEHMRDRRSGQYSVNELYHYGPRVEKEDQPVILYSITISGLKSTISANPPLSR